MNRPKAQSSDDQSHGNPKHAEVTVNGEARRIEPGTSLSGLIQELGFEGRRIAAEVNLEVVPKTAYERHVLQDGDRIEIVSFVGGG